MYTPTDRTDFSRAHMTLGQLRIEGRRLGLTRMGEMSRKELVEAIVRAEREALRAEANRQHKAWMEGRAR